MYPLSVSLLALLLMVGAFWAGFVAQGLLPETHRSRESVDSVRVIITLLLTFAALVLGLLISASQARFSAEEAEIRGISVDITELDQRLRDYGTEVDPLRAQLILYTKVTIADLWPDEPLPPGDYAAVIPLVQHSTENLALGRVLNQIDLAIRRLAPSDAFHRSLAADLQQRTAALVQDRWKLVVNAAAALPMSSVALLLFWLAVIFAIAGLSSSRNVLMSTVTLLAALSLASSIFLALELDTPLVGFIRLARSPMQGALTHIMEPPVPAGAS